MSIEDFALPKVIEQHKEKVTFRELAPETMTRLSETLHGITEDPMAFLDKGGAGRVFRLPGGACMKVMNSHNESKTPGLKPGNTLEQEAHFMDRLTGFNVEGTRTPYFLSTMRDAELSALLMEEIVGANLQRILRKEVPLPETYSHHQFFDSLERYLRAFHAEQELVHCDLEARNVMIDFKTGLPRLVDFGRTINTKYLPEEERKRLEEEDWKKLEVIEESMNALQRD